jgi:Periplasmic binding protein
VKNWTGRVLAMAMSGAVITVASLVGIGGQPAGAASGKAYKVMVIGSLSGVASYQVPEIVPAAKAFFDKADPNVTVLSCDDQFSASDALDCEHEAVADGVSAVIGGFAELAENESILEAAGIPAIGTTDTTSSVSIALSNGTGLYAGIGVGLSKTGCTKLGILYLDGTQVLANSIVGNFKWKSVTYSVIPANAPDLSAPVAKLAQANVQCIAISTEPNQVIQAMTAIKQAGLKNVKVAMVAEILTPQVLSALGSVSNGMISIEGNIDPLSGAPVLKTIAKAMKAVDPSAPVSAAALVSWASADVLSQAAAKIKGTVNASSMLKALNSLRNVSTDGLYPTLSMVQLKNPAFKRFFGHYAIDYQIENGKPKPLTGWYDLTPALGKTASGV